MATTYSVREKENKIKKRPWTQAEDTLLISYISSYGEGRWDAIAKCSGLQRNGKSCRMRWVNYLRPDLKRTKISQEEERLLVDLHKKWGNRWSRIARYLPGRTDNEIKNFFRSYCRRKLKGCKERNGNKESIYGSSISVEKIPSLEGDSNVITNQYKDSQVFQNSGRTCHSLLESSCISDFSDGYEVSFLNSGTSSSDISSGKVFIDFTDQLWTIQEDCIVSST